MGFSQRRESGPHQIERADRTKSNLIGAIYSTARLGRRDPRLSKMMVERALLAMSPKGALIEDKLVLLIQERHVILLQYRVQFFLMFPDESIELSAPIHFSRTHAKGHAIGERGPLVFMGQRYHGQGGLHLCDEVACRGAPEYGCIQRALEKVPDHVLAW